MAQTNFLKRLTSRKFLLALAGMVGFTLLGVSGQIGWSVVVDKITALGLAYIGAEGAADLVERFKE